jgi:hypothetical protein
MLLAKSAIQTRFVDGIERHSFGLFVVKMDHERSMNEIVQISGNMG